MKRTSIDEEVSGEELERVVNGEYDHLFVEEDSKGSKRSVDDVPSRGT
jgi:hypothetical protein